MADPRKLGTGDWKTQTQWHQKNKNRGHHHSFNDNIFTKIRSKPHKQHKITDFWKTCLIVLQYTWKRLKVTVWSKCWERDFLIQADKLIMLN